MTGSDFRAMLVRLDPKHYGACSRESPSQRVLRPERDQPMLGECADNAAAAKLCRTIMETLDRSDAVRIAYIRRRWRGC
jgi:hypothetical protein